MVHKFFDKKSVGGAMKNQQLADEFHKPIIRKFKRSKVYSSLKDTFGVLILLIPINKQIQQGLQVFIICH